MKSSHMRDVQSMWFLCCHSLFCIPKTSVVYLSEVHDLTKIEVLCHGDSHPPVPTNSTYPIRTGTDVSKPSLHIANLISEPFSYTLTWNLQKRHRTLSRLDTFERSMGTQAYYDFRLWLKVSGCDEVWWVIINEVTRRYKFWYMTCRAARRWQLGWIEKARLTPVSKQDIKPCRIFRKRPQAF